MSGLLWTVIAIVAALVMAAITNLVSEEARGWLDLLPRSILRLAAHRLNEAQRSTIYEDEWLPELAYILRGAESRPITRLIRGLTFALGLLATAKRISQRLHGRSAITAPIDSPSYKYWIEILHQTRQAKFSANGTYLKLKSGKNMRLSQAELAAFTEVAGMEGIVLGVPGSEVSSYIYEFNFD